MSVSAVIMGLIGAASVALSVLLYRNGLRRDDEWSIAIMRGQMGAALLHDARIAAAPAVDVVGSVECRPRFIADPFLVRVECGWLMFFEVLDDESGRGVIALASSPNGLDWKFDRVVLKEPFHLSFPLVFDANGEQFMLPEAANSGAILLYRATDFPHGWILDSRLLEGDYLDPTIFFCKGRWWMFAQRGRGDLTLHHAENVRGPWIEHPKSPLIRDDIGCTRSAGRVLFHGDKVIRLAQDCGPTYGYSVRAFEVLTLSVMDYSERELASSPLLTAGAHTWSRDGMHHLDFHEIENGSWIAAVDGKVITSRFSLKRAIGKTLGRAGSRPSGALRSKQPK